MDDDSTSCSTAGGIGRVEIDLAFDDPAWNDDLPGCEHLARRAAVAALDRAAPGPRLALSLVLADDALLKTLNRDWRGKDKPTNVLSFPSEDRVPGTPVTPPPGAPADMEIELGDVVIARQTVLREAAEGGMTPGQHVSHLVVHGTLHLLGHDHETDAEADVMEALEVDILAGLGIPNPYA